MKDFKKLNVWEISHNFVLDIYKATENFPKQERYGIVSQLRRACISIATNIAEGCGRFTDPDFARFIQIATGSACEVEYLLILSRDLELISDKNYRDLSLKVIRIRKMLIQLLKRLRT